MVLSVLRCLVLFLLWVPFECRLQEHRQFQYNSVIDGRGTYNFAYDTRNQPNDAHSMHMEYRDANGIVRGRYGYTDPRGTLRVVEYEAGPDGFKARGDVGPDQFPHMEAPGLSPKPDPPPTPLRMAGWDPSTNPINERLATESDGYDSSYSPTVNSPSGGYVDYSDPDQVYGRRRSYTPVTQTVDSDVEVFQQAVTKDEMKSKSLIQSQPLTIYNIDVDPDEIRVAGPPASVERRQIVPAVPAYGQRSVDITTTSPEITYYERFPRRRIVHGNHYDDDSYPIQRVRYYSRGIQTSRPVRYRYRPHYHGQQYHLD